ncbi:MAG: L-serine ammonia-lyase, iron-sulfur-dependent subunit beta [Clostridia bacterium]
MARNTTLGVFDIIGPIMIGPSSSHTAGAARMGFMARNIFGKQPMRVEFHLHGSFARTYKGHGTGLALVAGLLGMYPDDIRIEHAYEHAAERGMDFRFFQTNLGGGVHPNTALIKMFSENGKERSVQISSLGGGAIQVTKIDNFEVLILGNLNVIVASYKDKPGVVAKVTAKIAEYDLNIAFMNVAREEKGADALMVVGLDKKMPEDACESLRSIKQVSELLVIEKIL